MCRKAYVHPEVLTAFTEHALPSSFAKAESEAFERAALRFLDKLARKAA